MGEDFNCHLKHGTIFLKGNSLVLGGKMGVCGAPRPAQRPGSWLRLGLAALMVLPVMFVSAVPALAAETTLECTSDTFISSGGPDTNYDSAGYLGVGTYLSQRFRTLLKFDLTGIPGRVVGAKLRVYYLDGYGAPNGNVEVYRLARAWTESQATWNESTPGNSWGSAGAMGAGDIAAVPLATVPSPPGYPAWLEVELNPVEVEALRSGAHPNEGLLLRADWEDETAYLTHLYRGRIEVNSPQLVIAYEEPAPPVVSTPASATWSLTLLSVIGVGAIAASRSTRRRLGRG
jgi:hypothetical protein